MSLSISTLNDSNAAAKSFVKVGSDRNSSEYLFRDPTSAYEARLFIKTQLVGSTKNSRVKSSIRRSLVQVVLTVPSYDTGTVVVPEQNVTVNFTITAPENNLGNPGMSDAVKQTAVAFLESFLSNTTTIQLINGEV